MGDNAMKRCMIVDNSSVIRKVAARILAGPDMKVIEAASGAEALFFCRTSLPDIMMVDAGLEDMPAVDLIREVNAVETNVKPQIIVCLTQFDVGAIMRAKRAGAKGYILKPFSRAQLVDRFREMQFAA